jgi:tetratricopeptide (TPR) repeat protein
MDVMMGRYALAEREYLEALSILRDMGLEDRMTAVYLSNLAKLYRTMGQYAKAEPYFQQSLAIQKKVGGNQDPDTASMASIFVERRLSITEFVRDFYGHVLPWLIKPGKIACLSC